MEVLMMVSQVITFDGGLSTKRRPHLIERNEGIICENVDLEVGGLCPLPNWQTIDTTLGKYIYVTADATTTDVAGIISNNGDGDDRS